MNEQLQSDFDKIVKISKISEENSNKKRFLNKFIESGFQIENKKIGNFWILVRSSKKA